MKRYRLIELIVSIAILGICSFTLWYTATGQWRAEKHQHEERHQRVLEEHVSPDSAYSIGLYTYLADRRIHTSVVPSREDYPATGNVLVSMLMPVEVSWRSDSEAQLVLLEEEGMALPSDVRREGITVGFVLRQRE